MSAPTPPVDGWPSKKQPEKDEKIKEGSNAKTSEVASTSSNGAGKMIKATESEPSIGECEDELYAEAVREEQELVFHKFSKTNTPSNSNTSTEPSIKSISSDTQSIRIDPVEGSGHEGRIFVNLCDDTSPVLPEMTRPKSVIHITGIPASSAMFQPGENPSSSSVQTQNSVEDMLQLYVGLVNEDDESSYANAVLQLLSSWKTLQLCVNSCKEDVPSTVSPSMHRSLDAIFREMGSVGDNFANGKVKVVQTKKFLSEFRTIAARSAGRAVFTAGKEHCAIDFICTVLQTLHSEVNKATRLKKESAQPAQFQPVESITSADEAWQQQVDTKDNSYLFLLVNSQLQSTVNCLTCGGVNSISWSTSWILNVPMPPPELAEKEEKKVLKLKDCIQHYFAEKRLSQQENAATKCKKCSPANQPATKKLTVTRAPANLLIHLDRSGKDGNKQADRRPVLIEPQIKFGGETYNLLNAVVLQKERGHYVALHAQHYLKWVLFDDHSVTVIPSGLSSPTAGSAQDMMSTQAYLMLYKVQRGNCKVFYGP